MKINGHIYGEFITQMEVSKELRMAKRRVAYLLQNGYIATCVYGSYDCPEVWTLRCFRDNTLAKNIFGRAFIKTYYAISPTLVKWFGGTNWFKKLWKARLDKMVSALIDKGLEDTPYENK